MRRLEATRDMRGTRARRATRLAGAVCALAALLATPAAAGTPGSEATAFADIEVGARPLGMGHVGAVFARSAWATYWNPANLFHIDDTEVAVDYADLFGLGIASHTTVAVAWRREPTRHVIRDKRVVEVPDEKGILGFGVSIAVTSFDLSAGGPTGDGDDGAKSYSEVAPGFSMSGQPWHGIALGGSFRLLRVSSDLQDVSAIGYALDLGLIFERIDDLPVAFTARNLISTLSWSDQTSDQLPVDLTLGVGWNGIPGVEIGGEISGASDNFPVRQARLGGEWALTSGLLALRAGLVWHEDRADDHTDATFGVGVGVAGVRADYAFVGQNDTLGDTHRLSLGLRF
jgi:hypothetical protein